MNSLSSDTCKTSSNELKVPASHIKLSEQRHATAIVTPPCQADGKAAARIKVATQQYNSAAAAGSGAQQRPGPRYPLNHIQHVNR